ncbi:Cation/calcium exchanger 4 [Bienertia sinuspersici]
MKNSLFHVLFKATSMIVLLIFLYNSTFGHLRSGINGGIHQIGAKHGRIMEEIHKTSSNSTKTSLSDHEIRAQVYKHKGYTNSCAYVLTHPECTSAGFLNYIKFFYCDCKNFPTFGYLILGCWLAILFYLLGNNAADYFCCSLEKLSENLNMSPTVAGVTLLPFGYGALDVFASIAAFLGGNSDSVGLNSVLGGTVFVICVVGVVSLCVADKRVQIDKKCFIRDLCFFLFTIVCLMLILVIGKVTIWGAMAFVSIYVVYALFVAVTEIMKKKGRNLPESDYVKASFEDGPRPVWGWNDNEVANEESSSCSFSKICSFLEIPLIIPRRLTIPIVEEEKRLFQFYT